MDFLELVKENRSYRGYDASRKVTREELERMVECARCSPSSSNNQVLKFYLASDEDKTSVIQPLTRWAGKLPELKLPREGHAPTAFIVICVDTRLCPEPARADKDVGITAQSMLLCAASMGLGGCMIGAFRPELKQALNLDEHLQPALVVALGKPDEQIVLEDAQGSIDYYRDTAGTHHVPKRPLSELIIV